MGITRVILFLIARACFLQVHSENGTNSLTQCYVALQNEVTQNLLFGATSERSDVEVFVVL